MPDLDGQRSGRLEKEAAELGFRFADGSAYAWATWGGTVVGFPWACSRAFGVDSRLEVKWVFQLVWVVWEGNDKEI